MYNRNLHLISLKSHLVLSILSVNIFLACQNFNSSELMDGDIIFQTSLSSQSEAIQIVTHSKYSHMGMLYKNGTEIYVLEAVQPVKLTPLKKWIARGKDGHLLSNG